jgi:hypothetical protein
MFKALSMEWGKMRGERVLGGLNGMVRMAEKGKNAKLRNPRPTPYKPRVGHPPHW